MTDDNQGTPDRREIIAAYAQVLAHPETLMKVCLGVQGGHSQATAAIAEAFDLSEAAATAVLHMQVLQFTPAEANNVRRELTEIDELLREG